MSNCGCNIKLPIRKNWFRVRGDTKAFIFTVQDENCDEFSFAGYSFLMTANTLKNPPDDSTQVFQITGTFDIEYPTDVFFIPTDSDVNRLDKIYYDVQMTDPNGLKYTLARGSISFSQDITKD